MLISRKNNGKIYKRADNNRSNHFLFRRFVNFVLVSVLLFGAILTAKQKQAHAVCICCGFCSMSDMALTTELLETLNEIWEPILKDDVSYIINNEYHYLNQNLFGKYLTAFAELTEYLSAYGLYQVEIMGSFFDARNQVETSRLLFKLQAEAHRDYQPSDDFCWIGTNVRSLAASENLSRLNMLAMSKIAIDRQLGKKNMSSAYDASGDKTSRWRQFVNTFCDEKDNGWNGPGTGLESACDHDGSGTEAVFGAEDRSRINIDIDYTRLIDVKRTLEVDFSNDELTDDESAVIAMSSNLYGNRVPARTIDYNKMKNSSAARSLYLDQRAVIAKRGVAQNSFNAIVAMKSAGSSDATNEAKTASYMGAILKDIMPDGTSDDDIFEILGKNPSYYAQLEILSKKIYQNPKFFARLYDTPANIERKSVAMKAIELMVDRALFESELRQEMLLSVMLSSQLDRNFRQINKRMTGDGQK